MQIPRYFPSWKTLKVKSGITTRYCNLKAPFPDEEEILKNTFHPLHSRYRDAYNDLPDDVLRWRISARPSTSVLSKAVLRNRLQRRWKNAFADALRNKGYAFNGTKLVDGEKRPGLQGTLEMPIHQGKGMDLPYAELLKQAALAIAAVEKSHLPARRIAFMSKGQQDRKFQLFKSRVGDGADLEETLLG